VAPRKPRPPPPSGRRATKRHAFLIGKTCAGAASVGWIFESRAVVWAPLLVSLAGWLALPHTTPDEWVRLAWLLLLLGTSAVANGACSLRHRSQALV